MLSNTFYVSNNRPSVKPNRLMIISCFLSNVSKENVFLVEIGNFLCKLTTLQNQEKFKNKIEIFYQIKINSLHYHSAADSSRLCIWILKKTLEFIDWNQKIHFSENGAIFRMISINNDKVSVKNSIRTQDNHGINHRFIG